MTASSISTQKVFTSYNSITGDEKSFLNTLSEKKKEDQ